MQQCSIAPVTALFLTWALLCQSHNIDLSGAEGREWTIRSINGTSVRSSLPVYALEALHTAGLVSEPTHR